MVQSKGENSARLFISLLLLSYGIIQLIVPKTSFRIFDSASDFIVQLIALTFLVLGGLFFTYLNYKRAIGTLISLFLSVIIAYQMYEISIVKHFIPQQILNQKYGTSFLLLFVLVATAWSAKSIPFAKNRDCGAHFYDFTAKDIEGKEISMSQFKGKVVIVVNTASKCGFSPQLISLQKLHEKYHPKGVVILGFPCNQFLHQEPHIESKINEICYTNYGVTFPMFSKVEVNGENVHPIFKHLKCELGGMIHEAIKWNYTKFLIDQEGKPVIRFAPTVQPEKMESYIQSLLEK